MNKESKFEYMDNFLSNLKINNLSFVKRLDSYLVARLNNDAKKELDMDCIYLLIADRDKRFSFENGKYIHNVHFDYNDILISCVLVWYDKINYSPIDFKRDTSDINIQFELEYKSDLEIQKWDLFPSVSTDFIKYKFKPIEEFLFVSRKYKWLEFFGYDNKFENTVFIKKMDLIVREKIETKLDKALDWSDIMMRNLYPCRTSIYTHRLENRGIGYIYRGHLQHMLYMDLTIPIDVIWYNPPHGNEMDIQSLPPETELVFDILLYIGEGFELYPEFFARPKTTVRNNRLKLKLKFPVTSELDSMPHEGQFGISLWNVDDIEKVSEVLEDARSAWNNQTDLARETGDESLERGYCHNISFNTLDEKVGYWYIDSGSTTDGIYEFLLKALSDSGIKIKHVEIFNA
jgi:hypothetical protein